MTQYELDYALKWASINGHTEIVKLLLEHGADVHAENDWALRWAYYYGHTEIVKLLTKTQN
jgi:ankyrin repeat protein